MAKGTPIANLHYWTAFLLIINVGLVVVFFIHVKSPNVVYTNTDTVSSTSSDSLLNVAAQNVSDEVNPHPFQYMINCPEMCRGQNVTILTYVHTAPLHFSKRMGIRQTWGNATNFNETIKVVFFLGRVVSKETQRAIYHEAIDYGDIVQEDFLDTYHNLTYKGIAALKWITIYCPHAEFILKTDDDVFTNTYVVLNYLRKAKLTNKPTRSIMCIVYKQMHVMRVGLWSVNESVWSDHFYPVYCSGTAYIITPDLISEMHRISYQIPFFWIDDVYISGIIPKMLGNVTFVSLDSSYLLRHGPEFEEMFTGPKWEHYMFALVQNRNSFYHVWRLVSQLARGEISPRVRTTTPAITTRQTSGPVLQLRELTTQTISKIDISSPNDTSKAQHS